MADSIYIDTQSINKCGLKFIYMGIKIFENMSMYCNFVVLYLFKISYSPSKFRLWLEICFLSGQAAKVDFKGLIALVL